MIVTKRDGRKVEFDKTKIENAILKAHKSIYHGENFEDIQDFAAKVRIWLNES